ncbi:MAG: transporter [Oceanospirillaceae bacterium]|nr:transporter [Oceanospirillaceae bacterium]
MLNKRSQYRCSKIITKVGTLLALLFASGVVFAADAEHLSGGILEIFEPVVKSGLHGFFELLDKQPIVFLLLAMALGYPLGKLSLKGVSLGPTAGTLVVGLAFSIAASAGFGITYAIPGILSSVFLLLFMYALGLKVGPQFFAGLKSGGLTFVALAIIVWSLNWLIVFFGVKLTGLAPGYAAGILSGSYTVTAVMGVAGSAIQSGAYVPPPGMTAEQVSANMAAGYAISYVISTIGIILLIKYLPQMFGRDPIADAKQAEKDMSGGATELVPGVSGSLNIGFSAMDIRAYKLQHEALIGKTVGQLFDMYPNAPILRIVRGSQVIEPAENPTLERDDIIAVRADIHALILNGTDVVGPEVNDAIARNIELEAADIRVGIPGISGKTLQALTKEFGYGIQVKGIFRQGVQITALPQTVIQFGDVIRVIGPDWCVQKAAKGLGGRALLDTGTTEVMWLSIAMLVGYLVGLLSFNVSGIPFALGSSAGCLLAGIFVSYFRSRNPEFGGPVSEGARSFLQDIGLNMFIAVLAANVGSKVISSFHGSTVIWVALIGFVAALLPVVVAFVIGIKVFKLNSVICDGACTGARNSTPGLNAINDQSKSSIAASPYPVTYALTTVLVLIGGYLIQILS